MMHTKSGEGRAGIHGDEGGREEGGRKGENGQKSKNHPGEEERRVRGGGRKQRERGRENKRREKRERKRKRRINGFLLTHTENVFFASRPISPEDKARRPVYIRYVHRVNEHIIMASVPELGVF